MKKKTKSKNWLKTKWVLLLIFIIHFSWFLFFLVRKLGDADFGITNLGSKMLMFLGFIFIVFLLYVNVLRKIKPIRRAAIFLRELFFIGYTGVLLYLLFGLFLNPPITITQIVEFGRGNGLHRDYVSASAIGSQAKLAAIAAEDQAFPDHDGFDVRAIKKAIKYNEKHPTRTRGASTISQQVAKNIFLWQGGGFLRKGMEVFFTFTIEKAWSKKIILTRYLNIAEMGKGIFGIEAAAQAYYGKSASALSKREAAQIIACLPNPKKYTVKPVSKYVAGRSTRIVSQMNNLDGDPDVMAIIK